jgi:hypothetical protein
MACHVKVRLDQIVIEASLAIDWTDTSETSLEKRRLLKTAEVNVFEHNQTCVICRPLIQEAEA